MAKKKNNNKKKVTAKDTKKEKNVVEVQEVKKDIPVKVAIQYSLLRDTVVRIYSAVLHVIRNSRPMPPIKDLKNNIFSGFPEYSLHRPTPF